MRGQDEGLLQEMGFGGCVGKGRVGERSSVGLFQGIVFVAQVRVGG